MKARNLYQSLKLKPESLNSTMLEGVVGSIGSSHRVSAEGVRQRGDHDPTSLNDP